MTEATTNRMRTVTTVLTGRHGEEIRLDVLGEATANEHLVITPAVDSERRWSGLFVLLHVPTGRSVRVRVDVAELRDIAERVSALDWSFTDPAAIPPGVVEATRAAIRAAGLTEPSGAEIPAHDDAWGPGGKGGGLPRLAVPMLRTFLNDFHEAAARTSGRGDGALPMRVPDPVDPSRPEVLNPEWSHAVDRKCDFYGLAYLLAALHRINPEIADSAAASLADAWDAGEELNEWAHQWRRDLAADRPLLLPGIPTLDGDVFGRSVDDKDIV